MVGCSSHRLKGRGHITAPHYRSVGSQLVTAVLWLSDALLITTVSFITRGQLWRFLHSGSLWTIFHIYAAVSTLCLYAIWWLANEIFVNSFTLFRMLLRDCAFVHSVCKTRWTTVGGRPPQYAPVPVTLPLSFWPWKCCRVTCDVGYLCANFSLPIGLSVLDLSPIYATDVRQHHRLMQGAGA